MMRIAIGIFIAALCATPAVSSELPRPDVTRWVTDNTDMSPAQVAIAGPDAVYTVERLGAPAPTGEVIALVRTESLKANWGGPQGFGSWDAHIIFDCNAERLRVIRSASYPEPNRGGQPKSDTRVADWFIPRPDEPSARLMAAACDASFQWPLRATRTIAKASSDKLPIIEEAEPRRPAVTPPAADTAGEATPAAAPPPAGPAAEDVTGAAKPAAVLASLAIEQPITAQTLDQPQRIDLASVDGVERPALSLAGEKRATVAAPKLRLASLFSPFAKAASLGKRLLVDGTRLAGAAPRRPNAQHASLGENASQRVANLARAGPGLD